MADEWCILSRWCTQDGKNMYTEQRSLFCHAKMILCLELNLSVEAVAGTAVHDHRICDKLAIAYLHFTGLICSFFAMSLLVTFCKVFCELACWFSSKCARTILYRQYITLHKILCIKQQKISFLSPQTSKEGMVCEVFLV